jgi:hypothetical protein
MFVKDFADEYTRYRLLGEKAMAQVSDDGLNRVVAPDGNSIAVIVRHIGGSLRSRFTNFLDADGEKPFRDRDAEFTEGTYTRGEIDTTWSIGFAAVQSALATLDDSALSRSITIRDVSLTVHETLCRSIAHTASHVGQIILLARIVAPDEWKTLSIPRSHSNSYNQNPTNEKAPAVTPR